MKNNNNNTWTITQPGWIGYAVTLAAEGVLTALLHSQQLRFPLANFPIPYVLVIMAVAYCFGEGPAVLAFFVGFAFFTYYFVPPHDVFWPLANTPEGWAKLVAYMLGTAIVGFATVMMRRSRRRVERLAGKLRSESDFTDAVLDTASALVVVIDRDGRIVRSNAACEETTGYSLDEVRQGAFWDILLAPEDVEPVKSVFKDLRDGGLPSEYENHWVSKNGDRRMIAWSNACLTDADGTVRHIIATGIDITERRHAERELAEAHADAQRKAAEFESFVSSIADGILLLDADGNVVFANDAMGRMLGVFPNGNIRDFLTQFGMFFLTGEMLMWEDTASYMALHGETVRDMRYKLGVPDGREIVIGVSASPVLDSRNRIIGATLVFRDQGERVEFERQRQELYEREHRIADILQQALMPQRERCDVPGCEIAVRYQPALKEAEVGGDFYDVFEMGDGKVGILIGDVAGKGLPAAMRVAAARYSMRSYAYIVPDPAAVMDLANKALSKEQPDVSSMLTAFFAVLDPSTGRLIFANGGHEPPILCGANGLVEELTAEGGVLGVCEEFSYVASCRELGPDDIVVMVTDGITEARRSTTEQFAREGLIKCLLGRRSDSPEEIASCLLEEAKAFAGGSLQDDAAIIVFKLSDNQVSCSYND